MRGRGSVQHRGKARGIPPGELKSDNADGYGEGWFHAYSEYSGVDGKLEPGDGVRVSWACAVTGTCLSRYPDDERSAAAMVNLGC